MAVFSIVAWEVKPGRLDDFLTDAREAMTVVERLGVNLKSARLARSVVAGPDSGGISMIFEYSDLASWGATNDAEARDPVFQDLLAAIAAADGPARVTSRALLAEISLTSLDRQDL